MRNSFLLLLLLFLLTGCRDAPPVAQKTVIDWVDFVKWGKIEYNGIHSGILADESYLGAKKGEINFTVADHVTDPNYKAKHGDAAFHKKGTAVYAVKGNPDLLAVKDAHAINGYKVYFSTKQTNYKWHFKHVPIEKVKKVEIYRLSSQDQQKIKEITGEKVKSFLRILTTSEEVDHFEPDTTKGDPAYYEAVLYTNEPVAYKYGLQFDGTTYFWHPWDTAVLSNDMRAFLLEN